MWIIRLTFDIFIKQLLIKLHLVKWQTRSVRTARLAQAKKLKDVSIGVINSYRNMRIYIRIEKSAHRERLLRPSCKSRTPLKMSSCLQTLKTIVTQNKHECLSFMIPLDHLCLYFFLYLGKLLIFPLDCCTIAYRRLFVTCMGVAEG